MRNFLQDLRYAFRTLLKSRGFAAVAALTLAVGIGANTAIFSVIDAVLLRPLPFRDPGRLVRLYETESAPGHYPFAGPDFIDWKTQNGTFDDMALFSWPHDMNLSGKGLSEHIQAVPVEANFFSLLGVAPVAGRTFAQGEDQPGKDDVAILSYSLWQSHYARDPRAVGQSIGLNNRKYTIVGVMPASFRFPSQAQLWTPLDMSSKNLGQRGSHWALAIGRMKPGVSLSKARADLKLISSRIEKEHPDSNHKVGSALLPLHDDMVGESRDSLVMILSAVGLVLLIACGNIANLLLSRAVARQKEMAVRSALGASRGRLCRQLLTESLLLSLGGGGLGLLLAWGLVAAFAGSKGIAVPRFNPIQINGSVLGFTFALAVVTGVIFGLFPAIRTSRPDLHEELKGGAGSSLSPNRRRRFTSNALVTGEIALSLLLLICAGLLLKDFTRLRGLDIGVRTKGVWTAAVQLPEANYKTAQQRFDFARTLGEQVRHIPGVEAAALSNRLPLEGGSNYYATIRGRVTENMSGPLVETHEVSPEYFHAMGVPLLKGRVFNDADVQHVSETRATFQKSYEDGVRPTPEVTNAIVFASVINETMARQFWPNQDPLGQMFSSGARNGPWRQVIGVVGDVRQWGLTEKPVPEAYDPLYAQSRVFLVLRSPLKPSSLAAATQRVVTRIDSGLPLFRVRTMDDVIADNSQGQRFLSLLVGSFATLAALLAAIGIYGVLSYAVTQRTREIGIRMSLGAARGRVLGDILLDGMRLAAIGFAVGLAGAFAVGRVIATQLHEVKPRDPAVFIGSAALLIAVALFACYLPARRAARLDPMKALHYE